MMINLRAVFDKVIGVGARIDVKVVAAIGAIAWGLGQLTRTMDERVAEIGRIEEDGARARDGVTAWNRRLTGLIDQNRELDALIAEKRTEVDGWKSPAPADASGEQV